ncbi:polyamine ABC transporter substrate-binding protein [Calothrix sp. NIES-3974]|uniref:polyamine ABC transporter substrate-binding protein n=1 Tax=Calothrix sp. NIES-3974 TaxID=2005462 RepID=UPI000BBC6EC1|nr:spermidine/putrescine ABC transporter substrate-binding protein [Calothrix sp. NIES-3974]
MMFRRRFIQTISACAGLTLTGCGWRLADVRATTPIKGSRDQLYLYTWTQYADEKSILKNFTTQTGIRLFADVYESNDAMLAKVQAGGGGAYSVIYPSDYVVEQMLNGGLLAKIDRSRLIGLENLLPQFQNPIYDPNNSHSIPFTWGTTGLIYNSEILSQPPQDWEYLWQNRDRLTKRITLLDDKREVMGAVLKMLGYSYNSTQEREIEQAYNKLQELKPAIAAFDTDAWRNRILAGDLYLAMCYSGDAIKITKENPKFKYVIPKSGTSLWTDTMVIPITAPNPDGAYEWINYTLQPDVSAKFVTTQSLATPNRLAFESLPTRYKNNTSLFPPEDVLEKCDRIADIGDVDAVYERYWTKLKSG